MTTSQKRSIALRSVFFVALMFVTFSDGQVSIVKMISVIGLAAVFAWSVYATVRERPEASAAESDSAAHNG